MYRYSYIKTSGQNGNTYNLANSNSISNVDLDNDIYWTPGIWSCSNSNAAIIENVPFTTSGFKLITENVDGSLMQTIKYNNGYVYSRIKTAGSNSHISGWAEVTNNELTDEMQRRIIVGSTGDARIVVTDQTLTFSSGVATANMTSIGTAYGKSVSHAIVQLKSAAGTVITSATVSESIVTVKAYNIGSSAVYSGDLACTMVLFLA